MSNEIFGLHIPIRYSKYVSDHNLSSVKNNDNYKKYKGNIINKLSKYLDLNVVQTFIAGPQSYTFMPIDFKTTSKIKVDMIVHGAYISSLWAEKFNLGFIKKEIQMTRDLCNSINKNNRITKRPIYISHLPKETLDRKVHIKNRLLKVLPILMEYNTVLVLENIASSDLESSNNLNELMSFIYSGPKKSKLLKYVGFCLDTAHLWGSNVNMSDYDTIKKFLNDIACKKCIKVIHYNGSLLDKGSSRDIHTVPLSKNDKITEELFKRYGTARKVFMKSGYRAVCEFAKRYRVPCIIESNDLEKNNLTHIKNLIKLSKQE